MDKSPDGPDIDQINQIDQVDVTELVKRSPILARLIEEVRLEEALGISGYNRMHNRHNRTIRPPRPYPYPQPEPPLTALRNWPERSS